MAQLKNELARTAVRRPLAFLGGSIPFGEVSNSLAADGAA
jgi:hypothetical protein